MELLGNFQQILIDIAAVQSISGRSQLCFWFRRNIV